MISDQQLHRIRGYLLENGISDELLLDDLTDHFCCIVEGAMIEGVGFDMAFHMAVDSIVPDKVKNIENDLEFLSTLNSSVMFRKIAYAAGYLSIVLVAVALLFIPFVKSSNSSPPPVTDQLASLAGISIEQSPQLMQLQSLALETSAEPSVVKVLLAASLALFLFTILPFWFYRQYQMSIMKLKSS